MSDNKTDVNPAVFSDDPSTYVPTEAELAARRKRNVALGIALAAFMVFVFLAMLARVGAI